MVVSHRGTVEAIDWANNLTYGLSSTACKLASRYKAGYKMQETAHKNIRAINLK